MTGLRRTLTSFAAPARQARLRTTLGVVCVVSAVGVVVAKPQQGVFRAKVDTVLLDVLPTDRNGVVVQGLTAADFEVRDNGAVQQLTHASDDVAELGVFMLLDTSGSLSERDIGTLRQAATGVAAALRPGDELRLITFSQIVRLHGAVDTGSLVKVFAGIDPVGETALHDALTTGFRLSERQDTKRPVVIAFSDGADTASWMTAKNVDEAARGSWAAFFAATPRAAAVPLFGELATLTGGSTVALSADFSDLPKSFLQILERVRQRYLLAFSPSSDAPGWHDLDVRVKKTNVRVTARRGYLRR